MKNNSGWHVVSATGDVELGFLPTLASAKEYVENGVLSLNYSNSSPSSYGENHRKKEFNAYFASEVKNGNYWSVILWFFIIILISVYFLIVRGY